MSCLGFIKITKNEWGTDGCEVQFRTLGLHIMGLVYQILLWLFLCPRVNQKCVQSWKTSCYLNNFFDKILNREKVSLFTHTIKYLIILKKITKFKFSFPFYDFFDLFIYLESLKENSSTKVINLSSKTGLGIIPVPQTLSFEFFKIFIFLRGHQTRQYCNPNTSKYSDKLYLIFLKFCDLAKNFQKILSIIILLIMYFKNE